MDHAETRPTRGRPERLHPTFGRRCSKLGTAIGAFGFSSVFGLATPDSGVLYGVAGTSIFPVDTSTGTGTLATNYAGQVLGASYGSRSYTDAGATVPDNAGTLALLGAALDTLALVRRKSTKSWIG